MNRIVTLAIATALMAGCSSNPKLTRHYDSVDDASISDDEINLSVFLANPKADEEAPFLAKLSERGQAELIKSIAARLPPTSDATALMNVLSKPPAADACAWANTTTIKKRLTLTVLGNLRHPADRIDKLQFNFALSPDAASRATFSSWDKFDSVYGSYDLGSAKYTQSQKLTLGSSQTDTDKKAADAGSLVTLLSGGFEASNSLEENMKYAIRRLSVGGALTANTATLVQEGGPYINLFGSSSAVFTLKLHTAGDPLPVHVLDFTKDGRNTLPNDVGVTRCQASFPTTAQKLEVTVSGSALKRLVIEHHDTISEGDDMAKFVRQQLASSNLTIASKAELEAKFFGLAYCTNQTGLSGCLRLAIENPESGDVVDALLVQTPADAAKLHEWLVANAKSGSAPASIGLRRLGLAESREKGGAASSTALSSDIVRKLRVVRLGGNID